MRISIVALNASPVLFPDRGKRVGGLETFAWRLAKGIATHAENAQTQFVVRSPKHQKSLLLDGVQVDAMVEPFRDVRHRISSALEIDSFRRIPKVKKLDPALTWLVPWLAFNKLLHPPFSESAELRTILKRFEPDFVIALGVNDTSARLVELASQLSFRVLLWLQSNADLEENLYLEEDFVDRYGVKSLDAQRCLHGSAGIVCQTETQHSKLDRIAHLAKKSNFPERRSLVIPNPIELDPKQPIPSHGERSGVLWIGRADRFHKRPLLAIQVAKLCPNTRFTLVLNRGDDSVRKEVEQTKTENVEIVDYIPVHLMPKAMSQSIAFLSTGAAEYEGFPNVLLEACVAGTPIVSLEDFDSFLEKSQAGFCAQGDLELAAREIRSLEETKDRWEEISQQGRKHVQTHHNLPKVIERFMSYLQELN